MKACIHCTQSIQDEALICKHCKKRQDEPVMRSAPPAGQKACVHCGQSILAEALICKHCKKQQSAPSRTEETRAVREVSSTEKAAQASVAQPVAAPPARPAPEVRSVKLGGDLIANTSSGQKKMLLLVGGGAAAALLIVGTVLFPQRILFPSIASISL